MTRKWQPTQRHLDTISELYSKGAPQHMIAGAVGLSPSEFSRKKHEYPQIEQALIKGLEVKADHLRRAHEILWERIEDGSNGMLCFYLKTQADYCEDGSEKIEREVRARLEQQREQIEREIGTKLRADADRYFNSLLEGFYNRAEKELEPDAYDQVIDLFPSVAEWVSQNSREDEQEAPQGTPDAEQP